MEITEIKVNVRCGEKFLGYTAEIHIASLVATSYVNQVAISSILVRIAPHFIFLGWTKKLWCGSLPGFKNGLGSLLGGKKDWCGNLTSPHYCRVVVVVLLLTTKSRTNRSRVSEHFYMCNCNIFRKTYLSSARNMIFSYRRAP